MINVIDMPMTTDVIPNPNLYAVAYLAEADGRIFLGSGSIAEVSQDEAENHAMSVLKQVCPECKGYTEHRVSVTEIKNNLKYLT